MQLDDHATFFTTQRQVVLRAHQERLLGVGPGRAADKTSSSQDFFGQQCVGLPYEDVQINKAPQGQVPIRINREGRPLIGNCFNSRGFKSLKNSAQFSSQQEIACDVVLVVFFEPGELIGRNVCRRGGAQL